MQFLFFVSYLHFVVKGSEVIDKLRLLCSAHYNGSLVLWDIILGKPKKIYCDQQTGIYKINL